MSAASSDAPVWADDPICAFQSARVLAIGGPADRAFRVDPWKGWEQGRKRQPRAAVHTARAFEEGVVSVSTTQGVMDRYFKAMGAGQDFSRFFDDGVSWHMVDSGQEVRGPGPVRDYILELHDRMLTGQQRTLVVTDGHAFLEGHSVNPGDGNGSGLAYCLVYDVIDDRISAMRCYGTLADLMPTVKSTQPSDLRA